MWYSIGLFLIGIGLMGMVIFSIIAVISLFKKKGKPKRNFIMVGIFILVFIVGGFTGETPADVKEEIQAANEEKKDKKDKEVQDKIDKEEQDKKDKEVQDKIDKEEQDKKDKEVQDKIDKEEQDKKDKEVQDKIDKEEQDKEEKDKKEKVKKAKEDMSEDKRTEQNKKELKSEVDELQQLYLDIDKELTYDELLNKLNESNLFYNSAQEIKGVSVIDDGNRFKIAFEEDMAEFKRVHTKKDHMIVEYSFEEGLNYVEYNRIEPSKKTYVHLINYEKGSYKEFNNRPEYAGYYVEKDYKPKDGVVVKREDYELKTSFIKVNSKEKQFDFLFNVENNS